MKASKNKNLSGYWSGAYRYAIGRPATPFNLFVEDEAGRLSGTTLEPNTFADAGVTELSATITGTRSGHDVTFRKVYDPATGAHTETIYYSGQVNEDFTMIEGEWSFQRPLYPSGVFRLSRASGASAEDTVEETVSVNASR